MFELTYHGKSFSQREEDNYVNVGQMCANHGKLLADWKRSKTAKAFLEALSSNMGIPILELIQVKEGNTGTWAHPLVAIKIGEWISPAFEVWCKQHIRTLIETGATQIEAANPIDELGTLVKGLNIMHAALVKLDEEQKRLQALVEQNSAELERFIAPDGSFYTVVGYANLKRRKLNRGEARQLGKDAAKYSRENGYRIPKMPDAKWGEVNTYHLDVLRHVFE